VRLELTSERLVRAIGCAAAAELIDDRISQGAVEPRDDGFVSRRLPGSCGHLGECILEDVLGQCAVAHPPLQVVQERLVILE
jgi:hypothetical protein